MGVATVALWQLGWAGTSTYPALWKATSVLCPHDVQTMYSFTPPLTVS
jgi:hypothetical protein